MTEDADSPSPISFERTPTDYRHWTVTMAAPVATLTLGVDPEGGLFDGYSLKTNSYDIGVDIELADAVQRLRFEHPEIRVVVITGGLDNVFCSGANIQMLAASDHGHKVNFCKFTNETRNTIEEASRESGLVFLAAVNGTAAGGGYELALACDEIVMIDDRSSAVSLPEIPLLAVLPGTGGLTRVVDKRLVRRDRADAFSTKAEGVRAKQALDWGLVDTIAAPSEFADAVTERADKRARTSHRPADGVGVALPPLDRVVTTDRIEYEHVEVVIDRTVRVARVTVRAPGSDTPIDPLAAGVHGARTWPISAARQLDDAVLGLRFNEPEIGTWVLRTAGDPDAVAAVDRTMADDSEHWLTNEIRLLWLRVLKRIELSSRSLIALIEPGSCFVGTLLELALLADRSYMLVGTWEDEDPAPPPPILRLTAANDGWYPMSNGLTRLATRFWGNDELLDAARASTGKALLADAADDLGLITFAPDDIDWEDEVRLVLEERAGFSPDALTGMEANYRFVGPETMETKIFARLTAWQNWIFQRPNAVGPDGALRSFGTGARPNYDRRRV